MGRRLAVIRRRGKGLFRRVVPLTTRKRIAVWLHRQEWLAARGYLAMEAVRDLAERDPGAFHRFLWSNHIAYAETYEVDLRFDEARIHPSRRILFSDLMRYVTSAGSGVTRVESILEVGCSMGYLLHHLEQSVFPEAGVLEGFDVDRYAVERGRAYLAGRESRVRLQAGDMAELSGLGTRERYDVVLCAGVLMYLEETEAARVVEQMLRRCSGLLVVAGLAHPEKDNGDLARSEVRRRDHSFIHNLDRMVEAAGGTVVFRRWEGPRNLDGNTIYFVFARPTEIVTGGELSEKSA